MAFKQLVLVYPTENYYSITACDKNRWGPPFCSGVCDNCYNGGICDDKTGECVCRPGFTGPNCLSGRWYK